MAGVKSPLTWSSLTRSLTCCVAISAACAALAGCGSSNSGPGTGTSAESGDASGDAGADASGAGDDDSGEATCENSAGLDTYVANLTKVGTAGLSFVLVASDPAPPARGTNNWTLRITDKTGANVDGATIDVKPFMPLHGHGSSVVPTVLPMAGAAGSYAINDLYLFMPGLWTITITAKSGTTTDTAVYTFCIAG